MSSFTQFISPLTYISILVTCTRTINSLISSNKIQTPYLFSCVLTIRVCDLSVSDPWLHLVFFKVGQLSPTIQPPGTSFLEDNFSTDGVGDGFRMIQAHYIYCASYFYYYYISHTSDHQMLDPGGWGSLVIIARLLNPFLEWSLAYNSLPNSLKIPFLSLIPQWDF